LQTAKRAGFQLTDKNPLSISEGIETEENSLSISEGARTEKNSLSIKINIHLRNLGRQVLGKSTYGGLMFVACLQTGDTKKW
jgi:hypothetical protein